MTERERFEEWWISQNYSGPYDKLMWGKELQLIAWQAALKGGEPVVEITPFNELNAASNRRADGTYRHPKSNTYTESETDEMLMKVAMEVESACMEAYADQECESEPVLWPMNEDFRAIVDKVKATGRK